MSVNEWDNNDERIDERGRRKKGKEKYSMEEKGKESKRQQGLNFDYFD